MSLLLENSEQMPFYTDMRLVFSAIPGVCESHDWLISDIDYIVASTPDDDDVTFPYGDLPQNKGPVLISGPGLARILNGYDVQFVWAVFSALPRGTRPDISAPPYADCNRAFWAGSPKPQLKQALFEIVCWDSTLTLLIGAPDAVARAFASHFTDAVDLGEHNRLRGS